MSLSHALSIGVRASWFGRSCLWRRQFSGVADKVDAVDVETAWVDQHSDSEPRSIVYGVEHEIFPSAVGQGDHDRPHVGCHSPEEDPRARISGTEVGVEPPAGWQRITAPATRHPPPQTVEPSAS